MKAVVMTAPGGVDVLSFRDVPAPRLSTAHELVVRLKAAGLNPVDTKLRRRGTYYPDRLPTILGCDGAGVVEEVGADVTSFKSGDAVFFCNGGIGGAPGTYAQYAVVDARYVARKPSAMSFEHAAALPLALITAWESLFDRASIQQDDEVLIHAGAGGVGHVAIQLARDAGARICTTVGSEAKAEFARVLGAERTVLHQSEDFVAAVQRWSRAGGVRMALDTVGGAVFARTFSALRVYGDLVTLLQPDANVDWKVARNKNLRVALELMLTPMFEAIHTARVHQADILARGAQLFERGALRVHVAQVLPLAEAARAHTLIERGGMQGKVVLEIS